MTRTDRSWMRLRRSSDEWQKQLNVFLDSKFQGTYQGETASCPCPDCNNVTYGTRFVVQKQGFVKVSSKEKTSTMMKSRTAKELGQQLMVPL